MSWETRSTKLYTSTLPILRIYLTFHANNKKNDYVLLSTLLKILKTILDSHFQQFLNLKWSNKMEPHIKLIKTTAKISKDGSMKHSQNSHIPFLNPHYWYIFAWNFSQSTLFQNKPTNSKINHQSLYQHHGYTHTKETSKYN